MDLKQKIENTDFEELFKKLGYTYFVDGDYKVNIIGVRDMTSPIQSDKFNDYLILTYKDGGVWKRFVYSVTTDPGLRLLKAPINSKGCAILCPGQYKGTYAIDLHKKKYRALCQRLGPVKVYRDANKDNKFDFNPSTIQSGYFGINIHRANVGTVSELIGGHSAGCQVFKDSKNFDSFMKVIEKSAKIYGNKFTYTLITSNDI